MRKNCGQSQEMSGSSSGNEQFLYSPARPLAAHGAHKSPLISRLIPKSAHAMSTGFLALSPQKTVLFSTEYTGPTTIITRYIKKRIST